MLWTYVTMDINLFSVFILLSFIDKSLENHSHDNWEHITGKFQQQLWSADVYQRLLFIYFDGEKR